MAKEKEATKSHCFTSTLVFVKKVETEGIPANGGEVAIPPQKNGLTGCDLAFQNMMSGLGGACKAKTYFCVYCECSSADDDLLGYASGSHASDCICPMCERNGRKTWAHPNVNETLKLSLPLQLGRVIYIPIGTGFTPIAVTHRAYAIRCMTSRCIAK